MTITHLKSGKPEAERQEDDAKVRATVEATLKPISRPGATPRSATCRRSSTGTSPTTSA